MLPSRWYRCESGRRVRRCGRALGVRTLPRPAHAAGDPVWPCAARGGFFVVAVCSAAAPGPQLRRLMLAGLAGAGIGASCCWSAAAGPVRQAPAPAGGCRRMPLVVAVVDGATLRLRDTVVRLHGVAAPARGRSCPDGQGSGYDCGAAASCGTGGPGARPPRGLPAERRDGAGPGAGRVRGGRHRSQPRPGGGGLGAGRRSGTAAAPSRLARPTARSPALSGAESCGGTARNPCS